MMLSTSEAKTTTVTAETEPRFGGAASAVLELIPVHGSLAIGHILLLR